MIPLNSTMIPGIGRTGFEPWWNLPGMIWSAGLLSDALLVHHELLHIHLRIPRDTPRHWILRQGWRMNRVIGWKLMYKKEWCVFIYILWYVFYSIYLFMYLMYLLVYLFIFFAIWQKIYIYIYVITKWVAKLLTQLLGDAECWLEIYNNSEQL